MDALSIFPAEVWDIICRYASIDGGHTARSLALVSRSLSNVSKRSRYHSLIITRWDRFYHAVLMIRKDPNCLGDVRHLFIALSDFILEDARLLDSDLDAEDSDYSLPSEDMDSEGSNSDEDSESCAEGGSDYSAGEDPGGDDSLRELDEGSRNSGQEAKDLGEETGEVNEEGERPASPTSTDDCNSDLAYLRSDEGKEKESLHNSSEPLPELFSTPHVVVLKEFLASETCQKLESLTLKLHVDLTPLSDILPPLPFLRRLTYSGSPRLLIQPGPSSLPHFPSLSDLRVYTPSYMEWPNQIIDFVKHHATQLQRLRVPMPEFIDPIWTDMLLGENAFPKSLQLIIFDGPFPYSCYSLEVDPDLIQHDHLLRRIQVAASETPRLLALIQHWKDEIAGEPGSWPLASELKAYSVHPNGVEVEFPVLGRDSTIIESEGELYLW
ncbi:hypothetical protein AX16_006288 [Volvariella volvacea WC 439]|nr:hypothetical protein AX16_006288 [Volvariella volvacea WC 439]